jgi:hypothetical protein
VRAQRRSSCALPGRHDGGKEVPPPGAWRSVLDRCWPPSFQRFQGGRVILESRQIALMRPTLESLRRRRHRAEARGDRGPETGPRSTRSRLAGGRQFEPRRSNQSDLTHTAGSLQALRHPSRNAHRRCQRRSATAGSSVGYPPSANEALPQTDDACGLRGTTVPCQGEPRNLRAPEGFLWLRSGVHDELW